MNISDVVRRKAELSDAVVSVRPDEQVARLVSLLAEHNIGACVVLDGERVVGIVSERDVARNLSATLGEEPVSSIMTTAVHTCAPTDDVESMAELMTANHVRHLPVLEDGRLVAVVSIGDIVKAHTDHLTHQRDQLEGYIAG